MTDEQLDSLVTLSEECAKLQHTIDEVVRCRGVPDQAKFDEGLKRLKDASMSVFLMLAIHQLNKEGVTK